MCTRGRTTPLLAVVRGVQDDARTLSGGSMCLEYVDGGLLPDHFCGNLENEVFADEVCCHACLLVSRHRGVIPGRDAEEGLGMFLVHDGVHCSIVCKGK